MTAKNSKIVSTRIADRCSGKMHAVTRTLLMACSLRISWRSFLAVAITFAVCLPTGSRADANNYPITARIDLARSHDLKKHVFGVHGELLWGALRYGDQRLAHLYNDTGFTYIRFPGGTTANYYRWQSGDFGCENSKGIDEKSDERIKKFSQALSRGKRTYSTENFVTFLEQSRTDFSLVVNVMCSSPISTRQWMEELRGKGINVRFVELGNELYYEEYAWRFPSVDEYMAAAREHALEVKRVFPDAKIGVVASSSAFKAKEFPDLKAMAKHKHYSRGLLFDRLAAAAPYADALAMHAYSSVGATWKEKLIDSIDNEKAYRNAISHFDERFLPSVRYLAGLDPSKEIWLSEWGVAFYGWLRKHQKSFDSTHYNALYVANALVNMFLMPEISGANYHNLPTLWDVAGDDVLPNPVFRAAGLFKKPVHQSTKVSPVMLTGAKMYAATNPLYTSGNLPEISAAFFDAGSTGYLIVVNKFDRSYLLLSVSGEGARFIAQSFVSVDPGLRSNSVKPDHNHAEIAVPESGSIQLPPHSVTRIRLKIER